MNLLKIKTDTINKKKWKSLFLNMDGKCLQINLKEWGETIVHSQLATRKTEKPFF